VAIAPLAREVESKDLVFSPLSDEIGERELARRHFIATGDA